jgi:hypothetical protein
MAHEFMKNEKENFVFCKHCQGVLFRSLPLSSYCEPVYIGLVQKFRDERLCPPESTGEVEGEIGQGEKENLTPLSPTRPSQSNANQHSFAGSMVFPPIFKEYFE